ncbi:MAG: hypothetical protein AAFS00_06830 [Bacteroidota bacterium]
MIRKIQIFASSLLLMVGMYSCDLLEISPNDLVDELWEEVIPLALGIDECVTATDTTSDALPAAALDYLSINYPQDSIDEVYILDNGGRPSFRAELESETVVVFDESGAVLGAGMPINVGNVPASDSLIAALDSIGDDLEIDDVYLDFAANGDSIYVVEFDDDFAVSVDPAGNPLCFSSEDDDDDDDDDDDEDDDDDDEDDDDEDDDDDDDEDDDDEDDTD